MITTTPTSYVEESPLMETGKQGSIATQTPQKTVLTPQETVLTPPQQSTTSQQSTT